MTGTWKLVVFFLRRDRWMLLWWIVGAVLLYWSQGYSIDRLYVTQAEFDTAAASMAENTAFIAMAGPPRALNTTGGQVAWQSAAFGAIVAGMMSMFLVGRHTRAEEESGRDELLRAAAIGRAAPLAATGIVVAIANVLLGLGVAVSLIGYGLATAGSVALGVAAALAGMVFGSVTLVAAQLTSSTRSCYSIAGIVVAASYLIRAIGDVADNGLSWASPIGWGQYMRAFAEEVWWPALISVAAAGLLTVVAVRLFDRRDVGAGMWQTRPGPARAEPRLGSPVGLAWRLQRGALIGWAVAMLLGGISYGSIGDGVGDLVGDSELASEMFGLDRGDLIDTFYATSATMLGLITCGFVVSSVGRLRSEESSGHTDVLLATAVTRSRWASAHLAVTVTGTVATVFMSGLGLGIGYALVTGDGGSIIRLTAATLPQAVPALVIGGVAWLGYGVRSRLVAVGWLMLTWASVVLLFGETFRMPDWLQKTSPFEWLPAMPAETFELAPALGLVATTIALALGGQRLLTRRDIG